MGPALRLRFEPDALAPSSGTFLAWAEGTDGTADDPGLLGAELARFRLPRGRPAQVVLGPVDGGRAMTVVDARRLPLLPTVRGLAALPPGEDLAPVERPGPEVLAWSVAAKLAIEHVAAGRLVPRVLAAEGPDLAHASWRVVAPGDARADRIEAALLEAAGSSPIIGSDGAVVGRPAVRGFLDAVADVCARGGREVDPRPRGAVRPGPRSMVLLEALTGADARVIVPRDAAPMLADEVALWSSPLDDPDRDVGVGLALRLEERPGGVSTADRAEEWRLALALRDRGSDRTVDAATVWSGAVIDLGRGPLTDPVAVLLRRVAAAARLSTVVDRALEVARPSEVPVDADALVGFLDQERIALEAAGVVVSLPPQLRDVVDRPLRLRLRVGGEVDVPRLPGDDGLSLRSLAAARWELVLGGEVLDAAEAERLSAGAPRLVRWRGRWVRIDPSEIERLRGLAARSPQLGLTEALAAALAREHHDDELGWLEVAVDDSIVDLVERVRVQPGPDQAVTDRLEGELRAYQARGVAWLQRMAELGLGAVLADQMGLGKTIQAIALLASRTGDRPHLVVAPTSVIGNWERELARFAPSLPVVRHHGDERASGVDAFRPGTVVVTTYALLRRDASLLTAVPWDVVVLDEAQQVKNPASLGARAARSLEARMRLAMTGTPVENRLQELWAIIDLTNPGLLGPRRVFERRFAAPIERWHDAEAADRLRRLIAPFVLRRRKTDEDVALDLPERTVVQDRVPLSAEQVALYEAAVEAAFAGEGLGVSAFERRGRILALITALKQVCNHPAHFLRDGGPLPGRSGKLDRLTELLGEVLDGDERVLVFTQYREMGELLTTHLRRTLGLAEVPFLHGGLTIAQRDAMVEGFQEDERASPVLVVSLRAGGTGLNLTRASQVVHFDRWWNPAVEDQATDRAHRIGQRRPVTVHVLLSAGTLEERIDAMLERKRGLADAVADRSEAWLTELDDDDLRELVVLSGASSEEGARSEDEPEGRGDGSPTGVGRPSLRLLEGGS